MGVFVKTWDLIALSVNVFLDIKDQCAKQVNNYEYLIDILQT